MAPLTPNYSWRLYLLRGNSKRGRRGDNAIVRIPGGTPPLVLTQSGHSPEAVDRCTPGQQPRWYNVRDGQAAYNGGNSDSGWLIVLEHGSHAAAVAGTPDRYVRNDASGDYVWNGFGSRYIQLTGNRWTRHGNDDYRLDPAGNRVRTATTPWSPGDPTPAADFAAFLFRYDRIPGTPDIPARGGQYIRWAHMAWCR